MNWYLPTTLFEDHIAGDEADEDGPVVIGIEGGGAGEQYLGVRGHGADVMLAAVVAEQGAAHVGGRPVGTQVAGGGLDGVVVALYVTGAVPGPRGRQELH